MSDLPIPDWLDISTASFLSTPEDMTDTLDSHSLLPDDQFANNASLYNNGSNGNPRNDSNYLFSDPLLYEDPSLPFEIDMHPPAQFQRQPTNQMPPFHATSSIGLQNVSQGCGFLRENLQSESAPGTVSSIDTYHPTKPAVDESLTSDQTKSTVASNGPAPPAQKTRKRHVSIRSQFSNGHQLKL
ncbi:hypothetical protein CNMCM8980_009772 [Aspergillus fumigatiaffinis]|jgi:hypothetical protein|uniref:Uncharacterized protein n=1 Tax=Aspergillus fumigatiaffinis TaxID=340414 RepID=A0A8H4EEB2_9EURO|nr:hypothetical protein CNMCM5878_000802 [Aspergillus fumigatiaffinis]KAF4219018.1 hypothetical protein CNMCM6457_003317 [Aspergillus fumigatiaffinis]KAF4232165.1 hypothetical protein CNMCM6805_010114 [Aspergillus fumigatiaffinis]KAF4245207.1 hypothetical protein CNMCM8980_009772 [Aspergillus fumigatiaffinis]